MSPLDDFRRLALGELPQPDAAARSAILETASGPALGRLAQWAGWLKGWTGRIVPARPVIALYAAVSDAEADTAEAVRRRLEALTFGTAPVFAMAQRLGAGLDAYDLALDRPSGDFRIGPSMAERECAGTLAFGMEAMAKTPDLLMLGALGGSAAAHAALAERLAGEGDPLRALCEVGGREVAALTGAILSARTQKAAVLLDGPAAALAAAVLHGLSPGALEHCLASQAEDAAHAALLERIGVPVMLDLQVTAGEGVAAMAALALLQTAGSALG